MGYEVSLFNKETGKELTTLSTMKSSSIYVTSGNGNPRIPRNYSIKNISGNEEIYNNLLNHIGKTLRMESDQINGVFEIGLDGEVVTLKEVLT
jgi:hypothetical protein